MKQFYHCQKNLIHCCSISFQSAMASFSKFLETETVIKTKEDKKKMYLQTCPTLINYHLIINL